MDTKVKRTLERFYKELRENLIKSGSLKGNSVFTTLIQSSSNRRKDFLINSGLSSIKFEYDDISYLDSQDYLQKIEGGLNEDKYVLTAKSIWYLDKEEYGYSEDDLIAFFQTNDFNFESKIKPLNSKEKLVLMSLIGVRCFSQDSIMNLKNKKFEENWVKIFEEVYGFLVENKIINKKKSLLKDRGTSSTVSYIMRRVNDLRKKTSQIYDFTGNKGYYLDLVKKNSNEIDETKLRHLFKLIFRDVKVKTSLIRSTSDFCKYLAYDKARYVKKDRNFINSPTDNAIYDSLKNILN